MREQKIMYQFLWVIFTSLGAVQWEVTDALKKPKKGPMQQFFSAMKAIG